VLRLSAIVPASGIAVAVITLAAWLFDPGLPHLDALCGTLLGLGGALSGAAAVRGQDMTTRRLGILGVGANLTGLALVALVYTAR
jgi:hypothetical protein